MKYWNHERIYGGDFRVQIPKMNPFLLENSKSMENSPNLQIPPKYSDYACEWNA